ncbi:MAG: RNA polymerase sigma factor [Candidatus Thermochlorobacter sp.]
MPLYRYKVMYHAVIQIEHMPAPRFNSWQRNISLRVLGLRAKGSAYIHLSNLLKIELLAMLNLHLDLSRKTDGELLALVAQREHNASLANAAFKVFYDRHIHHVFYFCKSRFTNPALASTDQEESITDLVQETFLRVFEKAHTFVDDVPDAAASAWEAHHKQTRAWLYRIAENLFKDRLRRNISLNAERFSEGEEAQLVDASSVASEFSDASLPDSIRMRLLKVALVLLPEREQDILRIVYQWYEPGKKLPSSVIDDLTAQYQTTRENIRKILSRTRKKIEHIIVALMWLPESERNIVCDAHLLCEFHGELSDASIQQLAMQHQVKPADMKNFLDKMHSKMQAFISILQTLPKREQRILFAWYCFCEQNNALPDSVADALVAEYQITPEQIVEIVRCAIEKIETAIKPRIASRTQT